MLTCFIFIKKRQPYLFLFMNLKYSLNIIIFQKTDIKREGIYHIIYFFETRNQIFCEFNLPWFYFPFPLVGKTLGAILWYVLSTLLKAITPKGIGSILFSEIIRCLEGKVWNWIGRGRLFKTAFMLQHNPNVYPVIESEIEFC